MLRTWSLASFGSCVAFLVLCGACAAPGDAADGTPMVAGALTSRAAFVSAELTRWNAGLSPADRAEKYTQMTASAFNFYRGTDHLFWADQANHPDLASYGVDIFLSGDLHVGNLGSYNDDQGTVVFGLNDFDQAVIADYQLDLWRLATSLVLVGRSDGLADSKVHDAVDLFTEAYLDQLDDDRHNNDEQDRRFDAGETDGPIHDLLTSAEGRTNADLLGKWTKVSGGARAFDTSNSDLGAVSATTRAALVAALPAYRQTLHTALPAARFAVKSAAQRLHAGLGSLGVARYYLLIEGPTASNDDDVILDVKAEPAAIAYTYVAAPTFPSEGQRAATAQRALDVHVDDYLGWAQVSGGSFLVRALAPAKDGLSDSKYKKTADFKSVAAQLGAVLATFHARSDQDFDPRWVPYDFETLVHSLTDGQHSDVRALVWQHASSYADQVAADWTGFKRAPPP